MTEVLEAPPFGAVETEPAGEQQEGAQMLPCPECEAGGEWRTFKSPQALAMHRARAHGVPGKTRKTTKSKRGGATRRAAPVAEMQVFKVDAALKLIFPEGGMPATREALERVTAWLEEGRALSMLRSENGNSRH